MLSIEKSIEKLQLSSRTIKRRNDINLRLGNHVLHFFICRVCYQAGMCVIARCFDQINRRVSTGNDERHREVIKYFFEQPDDNRLILCNFKIPVVETKAAYFIVILHLLKRAKNWQAINI